GPGRPAVRLPTGDGGAGGRGGLADRRDRRALLPRDRQVQSPPPPRRGRAGQARGAGLDRLAPPGAHPAADPPGVPVVVVAGLIVTDAADIYTGRHRRADGTRGWARPRPAGLLAVQIVVIAKEPMPGRVKTRLTPAFTPAQAAAL